MGGFAAPRGDETEFAGSIAPARFFSDTSDSPPLPPGAPPPRSTDAPSAPKRNGNEFDDPHSLSFASIVNDIVQEFAMEYRARNHPRHAASADYDALQKKWQTKILTNDVSRPEHDSINFVQIGEDFIEILRSSDHHRILGRRMNLIQQRAKIEVANQFQAFFARCIM